MPRCATTSRSAGCLASNCAIGSRPARTTAAPLRQEPPGAVEQRVVRVEAADLEVALERPRALLDRAADVGGGRRLGEERRAVQAARRPSGEVRASLVERAGHA